MSRLYRGGLRGREALERLGALFLLSRSDPGYLVDDDRLTWALARGLFLARPLRQVRYVDGAGRAKRRSEQLPGSLCRAVGRHVRDSLARCITQIFMELDAEQRKRAESAA